MADKKKMSVEDILAACRQADGDSDGSAEPEASMSDGAAAEAPSVETEAEESKAEESKAAAAKPAGEMSVADVLAAARGEKSGAAQPAKKAAPKKPAAAAKTPGEMSVADILAAARGQKDAPKPKAPSKAKPAASKKKESPKQPAAAKQPAAGPMDTSSILAAARKSVKPGPLSKAEAAKQGVAPVTKEKPQAPPMPAKPAYAKPAAASSKPKDDRRGFFAVFMGSFLAIGFTSLALVHSLWGLVTAKFFFPNILIEPPSRFKIGFPSEFAPDTVQAKFKAQFGIWVTNVNWEGEQQIVALKTVCTHLGCTPNWLEAEQKFKCPCHGSGFYKDGVNFEGPAPRPLERYAISLADDGQLEVDKSRKFQQELGQWKDPACFVSV